MANPEQLKILKKGVKHWNEWRAENPNIILDLYNANLSCANLSFANLYGTNLSYTHFNGANLSHANLSRASLIEADLSLANLSLANLSLANLSYANLNGADLSHANFSGANLYDADLSYANLSNTYLSYTNFNLTNLEKTKISNAYVNHTTFCSVNLSNVIGLSDVVHSGPSYIDISTLYLSQGKIPESFLRGIGVPEDFMINHIPSIGFKAIDFYSCFISYNNEDKSFARRLYETLQIRGIRCWLDEKQMLPGDDIYERIDRGIRLWDKVLLCASQNSLTSWWVDNEIRTAFDKEQQIMKERKKKVHALIPLNLDGFIFSDEWKSGYKQQVKERLAANFVGWEKDNKIFEREVEKVIKALRTDRDSFDVPPKKKL